MNSPRLASHAISRRPGRTLRPGGRPLAQAALVALALSALSSLLALSGCGSDGGGGACTEIGCVDQVLLQPRDPQGGLVLKVVGHVVVDGAKIAIDCVSGSGAAVLCSDQGVTLVGIKPVSLIANFGSGDRYVNDLTITPTYATAQPNGAGCPPTCSQAVVDVPLGGGLVDGGGSDGGGGSDTGSLDTETTDAGTTDAGTADAGPSDAAPGDTNPATDTNVPGGCCNASAPCAGTQVCASGDVCKSTDELKSGECWTDAQCGKKQCLGAQICHCGGACFAPDKPGMCGEIVDAGPTDAGSTDAGSTDAGSTDAGSTDAGSTDAGSTDAGAGKGCCKADSECGQGQTCAGSVCKDAAPAGQCWTDSDCGGGTCQGAALCPCGALCIIADKPGTCSKPAACAKIDPNGYGLCDMVLGVGWDGSKCVNVSGCGCKADCDKLFKTMADCKSACP